LRATLTSNLSTLTNQHGAPLEVSCYQYSSHCYQYSSHLVGTLKIQIYGNSNLSDSSSITIYNERLSILQPTTLEYLLICDFISSLDQKLPGNFTFDNYNFTGTSTCLGPSELVKKTGYRITYSWDANQQRLIRLISLSHN